MSGFIATELKALVDDKAELIRGWARPGGRRRSTPIT
jgi:hypothetical protein